MLQSVSGHNFEKEVLESRKTVLVNFWIDKNEECQNMRKRMRELDQCLDFDYKIVEVNWQAESELAHKYQVFGTPSLLIFRKRKLIKRFSGTFDVNEYLQNTNFENQTETLRQQ